MDKMYKEKGGVNWCLCKVIAEYEDKVWIRNFYTGSMPVKNKNSIELISIEDYGNLFGGINRNSARGG